MKVIDKAKQYLRSISNDEDHYNKLLDEIYINPEHRNNECSHPEHETCGSCPLNRFRRS